MVSLNSHPAGRHFLQIPGPTNVPDAGRSSRSWA
jgi:alanine-glyoxylate transaminase/serine-glyoxylate transaminase/serine-pyruvate transaminase